MKLFRRTMRMKLVTYQRHEEPRLGVVFEEYIVDLNDAWVVTALRRPFRGDLADFLGEGREILQEARQLLAALSPIGERVQEVSTPLGGAVLLPPVPKPGKILCIGLNYVDHAAEARLPIPAEPVIFGKYANSAVGSGQPIRIPPVTGKVDYEAELAVVIGKKAYRVPQEEALQYVAGYTNFNDVSARDLQPLNGQWMKGKFLDTFAPMGPWLVTADEIRDPGNLRIQLRLNGEVMQDSTTKNMIFGVGYLVSYLSHLLTLEPGDVIATGTPAGVGFSRKPPVFLKPGDRVEVEIEGLGILQNPVAAEGEKKHAV
jgi:2-keto-4-pentenoate hydratase/2-oxohepta-3-ene-1,7-dioic acid hydratase in catechol pathway